MQHVPTILVVDDESSSRLLVARALTKAGYKVLTASHGDQAMDIAEQRTPDLILLDMMMPDRSGLEVCESLKETAATADIPVIFVTAHSDAEKITSAFASGGCDYITKPFMIEEILARVSVHIRLRQAERSLVDKNAQLLDLAHRLAGDNTELAQQTRTDALTQLLNRGAWDEFARQEHERAKRLDQTYCILLIDIDYFKKFNDSMGHPAGDDCLRRVAGRIAAVCRPYDLVGRYGGEEFIVMAAQSDAEAGRQLAERIRSAICDLDIAHPTSPISDGITASLGVVEWRNDSLCDVIERADDALYAAKRGGRNRVCIAESASTANTYVTEDPSLAPATILVADDNSTNRTLCRRCLEKDGYNIHEVANGQEALEFVRQQHPAVILMDVMMPVLDGLACTRQLKNDPATADIPIIMISARCEPEDIQAGLEAGADEYLIKPIVAGELALRVRSMVQLRNKCIRLIRSNEVREQQNKGLQQILEYCRTVSTATDLERIYEATVAVAARISRCGRVSIMVAEGGDLTVAHARGLKVESINAIRVPIGEGVSGQVFASGQPLVVNGDEPKPPATHDYETEFFASLPLVVVPLGSASNVVGVLNITERRNSMPFQPHELEYLDLVANIAGAVIDSVTSRRDREAARDSVMIALAKLAEHRDNDSGRHVDRVTRYCHIIAEQLRSRDSFRFQITTEFMRDLVRAVPLHDIGKVAIPDSVLLKPGRLTSEERAIMQTHAQIGAETIRSVIEATPGTSFLDMAAAITHSHHEWFDGTGYPLSLKGHAIPLAARITALADVYDALTTSRVYKRAYPHEQAVSIIVDASGSQFDPAVVDAFLERESEFAELAHELRDAPLPHVYEVGQATEGR